MVAWISLHPNPSLLALKRIMITEYSKTHLLSDCSWVKHGTQSHVYLLLFNSHSDP